MERIKKGNNMLLPAICNEIYKNWPGSYSDCQNLLNALTLNGNNVRYWLFEGIQYIHRAHGLYNGSCINILSISHNCSYWLPAHVYICMYVIVNRLF